MALSTDDVQAIASKLGADANTAASGIATGIRAQVDAALADNFAALHTQLAALATPTVDVTALAAALAPQLNVQSSTGLTAADVETALRNVLKAGVDSAGQ